MRGASILLSFPFGDTEEIAGHEINIRSEVRVDREEMHVGRINCLIERESPAIYIG